MTLCVVTSGLQMSFYAFIALTQLLISTDGRGGLRKVISVLHLAKLENINFLQTSRPRLKSSLGKATPYRLYAQFLHIHTATASTDQPLSKSHGNSIPR